MDRLLIETNTRIVPEEAHPRIFAQHMAVYKYIKDIARDKLLLEIGCGDGYGSAYLANSGKKIVSVDYDEKTVAKGHAKYRVDNLDFLCMGATGLGFKDEIFDAVCSFQVIEHIPEDKLTAYLSEVRRVLKSDGEFYLSTPNIDVMNKGKPDYKKSPAHYKEFTISEIKKLLSNIFAKVDMFGVGLTFKHIVLQRLKKIGIAKIFPDRLNPVRNFFNSITTDDFVVSSNNLTDAVDIICRCRKA